MILEKEINDLLKKNPNIDTMRADKLDKIVLLDNFVEDIEKHKIVITELLANHFQAYNFADESQRLTFMRT